MQQAAAGAGVREDILDVVRADGSWVTILATAGPVVDESVPSGVPSGSALTSLRFEKPKNWR